MTELGTFLRFNNERFSTLKNLQNHLIVIKRKWGIFQIIQPTGFTLQGAGHKKAMGQQKLDITVEQYYYIKHNKQLKHLHLPLIIEQPSKLKPNHENFYPLELLLIYPNIIYNYNF